MTNIVVLKTGDTLPELLPRFGDFEDWIVAAMAVPRSQVTVYPVLRGTLPASFDGIDGVVITGSHDYITDAAPWMLATAEWLRGAIAHAVPTLGICFGHQMLAGALGGAVGDNPRGAEICTTTVTMLDTAQDDPLFAGIGAALRVHSAHYHTVLELPPDATVLARNNMDDAHAVRFAPRAWGVQFHPEMNGEIVAAYRNSLRHMAPPLPQPPPPGIPDGSEVLRRFARLVGAHNTR